MKTVAIDMWNQATVEETMFTLRTGGGTEGNDASPKVLIIYEDIDREKVL